MPAVASEELVLLTAAYLHVPSRRLRALAHGEDPALEEWLQSDSARRLAHARHQAREAIRRLERMRGLMLTPDDERYPRRLLDLEDPPALLFALGALPQTGMAIVGSRTPPAEAADFAREFAKRCGEPVISGLAAGIDAAAHRGAIDAGAATVAYVGTGLGATYPTEHKSLEEEIVRSGGAIASERLPGETVTKWGLAHRDRLQAAHCRAIVLISSESDGGAMIAMQCARRLGRARYALEPKADSRFDGNRRALAEGAIKLPWDAGGALNIILNI